MKSEKKMYRQMIYLMTNKAKHKLKIEMNKNEKKRTCFKKFNSSWKS